MQSGGSALRTESTAVAGGTIQVTVGTNDRTLDVSVAGSGSSTPYPVPADKRVTIPVPPVPPGTVLFLKVGKGLRARVVEVLVVSPSP